MSNDLIEEKNGLKMILVLTNILYYSYQSAEDNLDLKVESQLDENKIELFK